MNGIALLFGGVLLFGGLALLITGIVSVVRSNRHPSAQASYSAPLPGDPGRTRSEDGIELPRDYQDEQQWTKMDFGANEIGPAVDHDDVDRASRAGERRRGYMTAGAGALLAVLGVVLLTTTLTHIL